jgi:hypothetical protein
MDVEIRARHRSATGRCVVDEQDMTERVENGRNLAYENYRQQRVCAVQAIRELLDGTILDDAPTGLAQAGGSSASPSHMCAYWAACKGWQLMSERMRQPK